MRLSSNQVLKKSTKEVITSISEKHNVSEEVVLGILKDYKKHNTIINHQDIPFKDIILKPFENITLVINEDMPDDFELRQELLKLDDIVILDVRKWFEDQSDHRILNIDELLNIDIGLLRNKILIIYPVINCREFKKFVINNFQIFRNIIFIDYLVKYYKFESSDFEYVIANQFIYKSMVSHIYYYKDTLVEHKN